MTANLTLAKVLSIDAAPPARPMEIPMTGKQLTRLNRLAKKISATPTPETTHTTAGLFLQHGYVTEQLYRDLHAAAGFDAKHLADDLSDARVVS